MVLSISDIFRRSFLWATLLFAGMGLSFASADPSCFCLESDLSDANMPAGTCLNEDDVQGLMDKSLHMDGASPLRLTEPSGMSKSADISSCTSYLSYSKKNWFALTQRDMDNQARVERLCHAFGAMQRSQRPRQSYIAAWDGLNRIHYLPVEMLMSFMPKKPSIESANLAEAAKQGACELKDIRPNALSVSYANTDILYKVIARSDFDGDGIEDLLVNGSARASGGTASFSQNFLLTRTSWGESYEMRALP